MQDELYQYLYSEDGNIHLLHPETFEEIVMPNSACEGGEQAVSMLEGNTTTNRAHFLRKGVRWHANCCEFLDDARTWYPSDYV